MKNIIKSTLFILLFFLSVAGLNSCSSDSLVEADNWKPGIYFKSDSINYSFGVTPLEVKEYTLAIPIKIMGETKSYDRTSLCEVNIEKTNALETDHYSLSGSSIVKADSVDSYLELTIYRDKLGEDDFKVYINLIENEDFIPVNETHKCVVICFNNRVEQPDWRDWSGKKTWPTFRLGIWNPLTYIKFIELFREMEFKAPNTYKNIVKEFGEDLKNVTYGWPWAYDYSMNKYVVIPLYQYFMEENPNLGVVIPRPTGY